MLQLVIFAIVFIVVCVIVAGFSSIREWFVWAVMLSDAYMDGFAEQEKLKCVTKAARKRYAIGMTMVPKKIYKVFLKYIQREVKALRKSFQHYETLAMSVAYYDEDYRVLIRTIRDYVGI